jgi:hypothetical protein
MFTDIFIRNVLNLAQIPDDHIRLVLSDAAESLHEIDFCVRHPYSLAARRISTTLSLETDLFKWPARDLGVSTAKVRLLFRTVEIRSRRGNVNPFTFKTERKAHALTR